MFRLPESSFIIGICFLLGISCAYAQNPKVLTAKKEAVAKNFDVEDFTYQEQGRNPFEPILLLKAKTSRGVTVRTSKDKKEPERVGYELEEL